MQSVCLLPDLHFSPPLTADDSIHIQHIRTAVAAQCDLLIYVGDILTMDQCTSIAACASFYPTARTVVDTIGMPFLFTLGNHDGDPSSAERTQLKAVLNASAHHVGICDPTLAHVCTPYWMWPPSIQARSTATNTRIGAVHRPCKQPGSTLP